MANDYLGIGSATGAHSLRGSNSGRSLAVQEYELGAIFLVYRFICIGMGIGRPLTMAKGVVQLRIPMKSLGR